jgi:transposase-like protein
MYSYEQRITAVKLYIKLKHKSAEVKRLLGYPGSVKYIRQWYLQYKEHGDDLPRNYKKRLHFTEAQKQNALSHYFDHGRCAAFTIRELGYPCRAVLNRWLDESNSDPSSRRKTGKLKPKIINNKLKKKAVIE